MATQTAVHEQRRQCAAALVDDAIRDAVRNRYRTQLAAFGTCEKCGCTDFDACIDKNGIACAWVNKEHTLCSACAEVPR